MRHVIHVEFETDDGLDLLTRALNAVKSGLSAVLVNGPISMRGTVEREEEEEFTFARPKRRGRAKPLRRR